MHIIKTYIKAVCFFAALLLFQGCLQDGVIDKATMSRIVMEMYLADQYIEGNPQMRAQTDSLAVYPAIMEKYGYTLEKAMDTLYNSETFARLQDANTGLYYQSPGYVYAYLCAEA